MKAYKVQIVKHRVIERTIKAENPEEAEKLAKLRYRHFADSLGAVQLTVDVIDERDLYPVEIAKN